MDNTAQGQSGNTSSPGDGAGQTHQTQTGGNPPNRTGGNPPNQTGGNPPNPTGGNPPNQTGGNPPNQTGGNPPNQSGGNPPNQSGENPPNQSGENPPNPSGENSPNQSGENLPNGDDTTNPLMNELSEEMTYYPDSPKGYKLPEGVDGTWAEFAHENLMTQGQLDAILKKASSISTDFKKNLADQAKALIKDWGSNAQFNLDIAKRALRTVDKKGEFAKFLGETGYGNHPVILKFMVNLGENLKEGGFLRSSSNPPKGKRTLAQALYPNLPSATNGE